MNITDALTAGMAVATVWLAVETRRMAHAASRSIELESLPALSFRGPTIDFAMMRNAVTEIESPALRVGLRLFNPGKVRVTYAVDEMSFSFLGQRISDPEFNTLGGVVFPAEDATFLYPWMPVQGDIQMLEAGEISFVLKFWADPEKKSVLSARLVFTVKSTAPMNSDWHFKDGPVYG